MARRAEAPGDRTALLDAIVRSTDDAIYTVDLDGTFADCHSPGQTSATAWMFWFSRNRLWGSYFPLICTSRS
jgi:hypothetical protein